MANIRVKCPTCESELELDEAFAGQEVECGSCGHVFIARGRSTGTPARSGESKPPPAPPPRRPEPRQRDDRDERDEREERPRRKESDERKARDKRRDDQDDRDDRGERDKREGREDRDRGEREERRPAPRSRRPPPRTQRRRRPDGPLPRSDDEDYERPLHDDYDDEDRPAEQQASRSDGLAVTSLVFGLINVFMVLLTLPFTCCCAFLPLPLTIPLSLIAIGTGAFGVRGDGDRKPMAIVGIVLGALCLLFAILQMAFGIMPPMK